MNRKEFLEKLGIGAAFALTATCLGGCSRDMAEPASEVDLVIDLSDSRFANLKTVGNFVAFEGIIIARSITGQYLAATQTCSHESLSQVIYDGQDEWFCTAHGARYDLNGEGLNANGSKGLTVYNTEVTGNMLRIFS